MHQYHHKVAEKHPHQEFIQINTSNILFICGGAFEGLEKIVKDRIGQKSIGFGAKIESNKDIDKYKVFEQLLPQDLLKFGLIPEFVGRLPIIATLQELDRDALIDIVTKPKNALVKQYQKLFKLDNVDLEFEQEALNLIVDKAIERKTGARGFTFIIEEIMRDIMFEIPSNPKIEKCIITEETVRNGEPPKIIINNNREIIEPKTVKVKRQATTKKIGTAKKMSNICLTLFLFVCYYIKEYEKLDILTSARDKIRSDVILAQKKRTQCQLIKEKKQY